MTSRDDIGRANLFRRRSHLEKFRDAVSFRFFLPFFLFIVDKLSSNVFIFTTITGSII